MPIRTTSLPFHTITIDFVLALPDVPAVSPWAVPLGKTTATTFNATLTITNKTSKKSLLLPGYSTYTAQN
jgi:hypothetical protein